MHATGDLYRVRLSRCCAPGEHGICSHVSADVLRSTLSLQAASAINRKSNSSKGDVAEATAAAAACTLDCQSLLGDDNVDAGDASSGITWGLELSHAKVNGASGASYGLSGTSTESGVSPRFANTVSRRCKARLPPA